MPGYYAHPTAVVDSPVQIGENTKIWHFTHVMAGAIIGRGCVLGQNVCVAGKARLGNGVKVQNNVSIYDCVELEDDVFCGPSAVFTNVVHPRAHVNRKDAYATTLVRQGASIGANATIVCGVTIGRYAFVAAGATVTRDVPDYALVMGVPARQAGWVCVCGETLKLQDEQGRCLRCQAGYRLVQGHLEADLDAMAKKGGKEPVVAARIIGRPSNVDALLPA